MADRGGELRFFWDIHITIDKGWHLQFHEIYEHQIWRAGISRGVDSLHLN